MCSYGLNVYFFFQLTKFSVPSSYTVVLVRVCAYYRKDNGLNSQTSMAQIPLGPWKLVRAKGSSNQ